MPKYVLHIDCHFRLSCGNEIILSTGDVFQPSSELHNNSSFDYEAFNWDVSGNNRFDEITKFFFQSQDSNFVVSKVVVNKLGDVTIHFENGFSLEVCPDISGREECWRFFEQRADSHLIVSGRGIEEEDDE